MFIALLGGCAQIEGLLFDVREEPTEVSLSGYIYRGPFPDAEDPVISGEGASLEFLDEEGELLASAEEIYPETYPGYWQAILPPDAPFSLRIDGGGDCYPALWLGRSPPRDGLFPADAPAGSGTRAGVFGWPTALVDPFFESVAVAEGVTVEPLDDGQLAHLWGGPLDPDAIRGDRIYVQDGDGDEATVFAYAIDDATGSLVRTAAAPVHYFLAFNLAPGDITVSFEDDAGQVAVSTYTAAGGEIVAPWFFRGP